MNYTKKGPGDLYSDDYEETHESEFGECQECGEEISLSQVEKTRQHVTGESSSVEKEEHDIDPRFDYWIEIPYGICKECMKEFESEEE